MTPSNASIGAILDTRENERFQTFSTLLLARILPRPIYRDPLGLTRFYCQGALFPWPDKTCNQFPIQFFTISRGNHSKWFCCYINHVKTNHESPSIPNSYCFLLPISILCSKISLHKRCACAVSWMRSPGKLIEYS